MIELPHDDESEAQLLSLGIHWIADVDECDLATADFYWKKHQDVWSGLLALVDGGTTGGCDKTIPALKQWLVDNCGWEMQAAKEVCLALMARSPGRGEMAYRVDRVAKAAIRRRLWDAGQRVQSIAIDEQIEIEDGIYQAAAAVDAAEPDVSTDDVMGQRESITALVGELSKPIPDEPEGLSFGLASVDAMMGRMDHRLYIVAGRPAMGKSVLVDGVVALSAIMAGKRVVCFHQEMEQRQVAMRRLSKLAKVAHRRIKARELSEFDMAAIAGAADRLSDSAPTIIDATPRLTVQQVRARCRRYARRLGGLDLVVVDHFHRMKHGTRSNRDDSNQAETVRGLASLAKEMGCTVVLAVQLSRKCEDRSGFSKAPQMADLRECGALEEEASGIVLIWRPGEYGINREGGAPDKTQIELIVVKARDAQTGTIKAYFNGACADVTDLEWRG